VAAAKFNFSCSDAEKEEKRVAAAAAFAPAE
jgi:hypothetical protein